jgi:hypothetical protein
MSLKKTSILTVMVIVVALVGVASSPAAETIATKCFTLSPFIDTLRITLSSNPGGVTGGPVRWRAGTPNLYSFVGSASVSADPSAGNSMLTFVGMSDDASLGFTPGSSVDVCNFIAHPPAGTWFFSCSSGAFNSGTLVADPVCPAGSAKETKTGPTAISTR